jgi:hypothetical protein
MQEPPDRYTLFPELRGFEAAMHGDPAVLGVLYTGSLGSGSFDRYSDLDVQLWLADEAPFGPQTLRELIQPLGEIHAVPIGKRD